MKHFSFELISNSLKLFPDLYNTFIDESWFTPLQGFIQKSIWEQNVFLQRWLELQVRYSISDDINPFIIQYIL